MQDEVGIRHLLQRRAEGLDQLVRKMPDEPDGVGQRERPACGRAGPAHGWVEGREERVVDQHVGTGQPIEQAGLPGIGVSGDRHRRHCPAPPLAALDFAADRQAGQLVLQLGNARPDPAPISLDLGLAGPAGPDAAAAGHPASGLAGQRLAPATQPGQQVLQLGELDLGLALLAAGMLGENIQDQRRAVDDLDLHDALELAELPGGELAVADDGVGTGVRDDPGQLGGLARADIGSRVRPATPLDQALEYFRPGGLGQQRKLAQRVLGGRQRPVRPHAHQHHALKPKRPVLDLADVLELGGQPGHPAQRVPFGHVQPLGARLAGHRRAVRGLIEYSSHSPSKTGIPAGSRVESEPPPAARRAMRRSCHASR